MGDQLKPQLPVTPRNIETNSHFTRHFLETTDRIEQILFTGTVIDSFMFAHHYWVASDFGATIAASAIGNQSFSALGYRSHQMFIPGTKVLCYKQPIGNRIVILGALNSENPWDKLNMSDWVHQMSACTFKDELTHNYQTTMNPPGAIKINAAHRPVDSFPGEQGWFNTLGMGIHLGGTAMFMRASELNGLWIFYNNNQMRLVSDYLQQWVAGREELSFNDSTELNEILRITPYPWELMGVTKYQTDVATKDDSQTWTAGGNDANVEPLKPDQESIYRFHQFRGYLGDVERIIVSAPPPTQSGVEQLSVNSVHLGLSETVRHENGALTYRSAKSISIRKELLIPVPKRRWFHDDPAGDDPTNYKFAGEVGSGSEHDQTEFDYQINDPQIRFAAAQDMHAWLYNSYGQAGLQLHEKDWYYPQERELIEPWGLDSHGEVDPSVFTPLGLAAFANVPAFVELLIDARPGNTHRYYKSRAGLDILDDGSVLLESGDGTSIRMGGGCLIMSAMADIKLMPGRNVELWAPRDIVLKAGNCLDGTASKGDVRLKAEHNMHFLAGNGKQGGLLLESRATGFTQDFAGKVGIDVNSSGIVMLSKQSQILAYGQQVYLRSLQQGQICLDADRGKGDVHLFASNHFETIRDMVSVAYGITPDQNAKPLVVETHTQNQVFFGQTGELLFTGRQITCPAGSMWLGGSCLAKSGYSHDRPPSLISGPWTPDMRAALADAGGRADTITQEIQTERDSIKQLYYTPTTGIGTTEFVNTLGFSLRNDKQYGITGLIVYESRWQNAYRTISKSTKVWDETEVTSPSGERTMPFPGFNTWQGQPIHYTVDSQLWDGTNGYDTDRRYANPKAQTPQKLTLASAYLITAQDT